MRCLGRDLDHSTLGCGVGSREHPGAGPSNDVIDPTPIIRVRTALNETLAHEAINDRRNAGPSHRESFGERRRCSAALVEEDQDAVLRQRQVDLGERHLEVASYPRPDSTKTQVSI